MNEKYVMESSVQNDPSYQKFVRENPSVGFLKIRASSAYAAVPVSGIRVKVLKKIGEMNVIFFEGETDESGMINDIRLPSPKGVLSDEDVPSHTEYELKVNGSVQNIEREFFVSIFPGITVIQYINITPIMDEIVR